MTEQRKVDEIMVNKTPLRLVAIEERPPAEDDQSATPIRITPEHEAITRKVPNSASIAAHEAAPEKAMPARRWQRFLPAAVIGAAVIAIGVVGLSLRGGDKPAPAPVSPAPPPSPVQPTRAAPVAAPVPAVAAPAPVAANPMPEVIRLHVTAEPVEAELSLDGNVLAGHRLNLEVPKDRGIHVVSASAPGYIPFNQQVSFSNDIVLNINLRRSHTPAVRQVVRSRSAHVEARPQGTARSPTGQAGAGLEPGMDLDGPVRSNAKPIDERNPYKP